MCRYFTCCSLFDPFCFCFRRPSYCFRPSRYSATASLDGFFSRRKSLCYSGPWKWAAWMKMRGDWGDEAPVRDLSPWGERGTDRLQSLLRDVQRILLLTFLGEKVNNPIQPKLTGKKKLLLSGTETIYLQKILSSIPETLTLHSFTVLFFDLPLSPIINSITKGSKWFRI